MAHDFGYPDTINKKEGSPFKTKGHGQDDEDHKHHGAIVKKVSKEEQIARRIKWSKTHPSKPSRQKANDKMELDRKEYNNSVLKPKKINLQDL